MNVRLQNLLTGTFLLLVSSVVGATPAPSTVSLDEADSLAHGVELTVIGNGFGNRTSDSPILVDKGEETYENGVLNQFNENLTDMTLVPTTDDDSPNAPWTAATNKNDSDAAFFHNSGDMRTPYSEAAYFMRGENAWIGRPKAYGGASGWDLPKGNSRLYVAWWIKAKYNPAAYYRITPMNKSGTFREGESIQTDSGITGRYIGTDPEGLLNFEFAGFGSTDSLKNEIIEGTQSHATTTFPDNFRSGSGQGYETPGSQKYIRIWDESSGKEGIRFSWTQMHQSITNRNTGSSIVNWQETPLIPNQWYLFEVEMDTDVGEVQTFVNGEAMNVIQYPKDTAATQLGSPTIALLGLNGKSGKFQKTTIDEIYMDNQFNRVLIGDAATFENLNHYELQNYSSWSNQKISFTFTPGTLNIGDGLYLYIANPDGEFNKNGYSLDEIIDAPPEKTKITVD